MSTQNSDIRFMQETFKLAAKAKGLTNPNPMVGAVIVKNGVILASGYHHGPGFVHAEVDAFKQAKESVKGATIYVNLEPCSHYGKNPPCVNAIKQAGITNVVCAMVDPNHLVHGKGITILQKAGITVTSGVLEREARKLNEAFITFHEKERPFIALKFETDLHGKIVKHTDASADIRSEEAKKDERALRGEYQAVLVGINTVLQENPYLGAKIQGKKDPVRIILDPLLKIPVESHVLRDTNVIIATTTKADKEKQEHLKKQGITVLICGETTISLELLLDALKQRQIISILVEGDRDTQRSFIDARLVDKIYAFQASLVIDGQKSMNTFEELTLTDLSFKNFPDSLMSIGYPAWQ